jgi:hypothetical protein
VQGKIPTTDCIFYGRKCWSVTLREKHELRIFKKGMPGIAFTFKREKVIRGRRKWYSEELHGFYATSI